MVSSPVSDRFEDLSEADDAALPEMMFADGEEPVGVRVLTYQSSRAMNTILNALQEDEIQYLRASPFGKLVEIAEKPAFSGRFARFILSRQLKVKKLHEAWFRFAGKPIRFSLREFAIVTGLPCGELPEKGNSKRKKHTKGKPYWPELFGTVEELSVSRAVKMLRKRSVTDKVVRQKLACLAIVSSVLLSTNVKMKMLKEYAELLVDIDEFFAFPWGRLAFNMLMGSIKKRHDEISLSKNTIALQGFALALQLVIVEAVPALTEVVQEVCSSSESDSEDEDNDSLPSKTKKQTLSPGYARLVDKNKDAIVKSIIPQDPLRPIDESLLSYRDEVDDAKVRNLVHLISVNRVFSKEMFRGGATKLEVEMMRDKSKASGKKKMGKEVPSSSRCMEQSQIISVLTSLLKPEMERIDDRVTAALASVEQMSASALSYQASVVSVVEGMLKNLKDDILTSLRLSRAVPFMEQVNSACNSANMNNARTISNTPNPINTMIAPARPPTTNPFITPPRHKTVNRVVSGNLDKAQLRENNNNEVVIMNVLENLSHYSTPPKSAERCQVSDRRSQRNDSNRIRSPHKLDNNDESTTVSVNSHMNKTTEIRIPSFSLNVSQNVMSPGRIIDDEMGENVEIAVGDNVLDPNRTRNSKRLKLVPTPLLSGYQYDTAILNRSREAKLSGTNYYNNSLIREKFTKLIPILQTSCVINVAGLSVTSKDILDIVHRTRPLPGKVFDILMCLVRSTFYTQVAGTSYSNQPEFLDSKFVSLLWRNYDKFRKCRSNEGYVFPKALVDSLLKQCSSGNAASRFYMPYHVDKKHWIGLCVDLSAMKVYFLDCNSSLRTDAALIRDLQPISVMFPHLLKNCGLLEQHVGNMLTLERVKGVAQNLNSADAAMTAALLIHTHALFGPDTCQCITPAVLDDESHRAAVMIYELHGKL